MCHAQDWPHWLEPCRLDDAALAEAYETAPAEHRALIKHCLALWHNLYGEDSERQSRARHDAALGFWVEECREPAPWAVVVITARYAAPTRLAAALMPAILARVPRLAVLCTNGTPSQAARLTLELAGVEDIFCTDEAARCLQELAATGQGSVALLHQGELGAVADVARALHLPLWEEQRPPSIHGLESWSFARFCHPDARCQAPHDASLGPDPQPAPLHLATGVQAFWQHPGLSKAFFRRTSLRLAPHPAAPCPAGEQQ